MSKRITEIELCHFRGATQSVTLTLNPAKPFVILHGENGTGKSTIIDAIALVCDADRNLKNPAVKKQLPSMGRAASDVTVRLAVRNGQNDHHVIATLNKNGIKVDSPEHLPTVSVMRRRDMLQFISGLPAQRYEAVDKFIRVSNIKKSEDTLRTASKRAEEQNNQAAAAYSQAKGHLQKLWEQSGTTGASAEEWARQKTAEDTKEGAKDLAHYQAVLQALTNAEHSALLFAQAVEADEAAQQALTRVEAEKHQYADQGEENSIALMSVLQATEKFLQEATATDHCPVCRSAASTKQLQSEIAARLQSMEHLRGLAVASETAAHQKEVAASQRQGAQRAKIVAATALARAFQSQDDPTIAALFSSHPSPEADEHADLIIATVAQHREALQNQCAILSENSSYRAAIELALNAVIQCHEQAEENEALWRHLKKMHQLVETTRKQFVDDILDGISQQVQDYYSCIHPGEPIGKLSLLLRENVSASIEQQADFHDHPAKVDPETCYSEAHLDTLGFCLFLVLARYGKPDGGVLVLDDIFNSVDRVHRIDIADLLAKCVGKEFSQIILSTHENRWCDVIKNRPQVNNKYQQFSLQKWTFKGGIQVHSAMETLPDLGAMLAAPTFNRITIAAAAGYIMEQVYNELTLVYNCGMRRNRENRYTLADLCGGVIKVIDKLDIIRTHKDEQGNMTKEEKPLKADLVVWHKCIAANVDIRNKVGAHYNDDAEEVSDAEIRAFAEAAHHLHQALTCPQCKGMATKDKGSHFICPSCGGIRMEKLSS